ncbi:hypothetical protein [Cupriavidus basilensis]|nr:hypothetical protein [Cupriavidus basilensis]MCP3017627.1 hypothetical protein [Cupriavidus basilensis]MDR3384284.1 hypothetical protein [Cupriavidus basilensis]
MQTAIPHVRAISAIPSRQISLAARVLDETTLDASADAQAPGAAAR